MRANRFSVMQRIVIALLCVAGNLSAQTFFPVQGPVLEQEVALQQADECYVFFSNPSGDTLQLRWRKLEVSMPPGWDIDLCDYGHCYTGIPNNATMNPVYDTIQPYLKLLVQPDTVEGTAWLWFRVYDLTDDDNFQDVYFSLHTQGVSSTTEAAQPALQVFPNPASEWLYLENKKPGLLPVAVFNSQGALVYATALSEGAGQTIPVHSWPAGLYWLRAASEIKQLIIQH
jgi:hypothetical protein